MASSGSRSVAYDATRELVIDPVLTYSVALGGNGVEEATAVALDAQGRIYLAGYTSSTDLPWARIGGAGGKGDVFVARLDPTGQTVQVLAYFGGSESDNVRGLALDTAGRMHVAGMTLSRDFPIVRPLAGMQTAPGRSERLRRHRGSQRKRPRLLHLSRRQRRGRGARHRRRAGRCARRRWRDALDRLPGAQCPPARGPGTRRLRDPNRAPTARSPGRPTTADRSATACLPSPSTAPAPRRSSGRATRRTIPRCSPRKRGAAVSTRRCRASRPPGHSSSRPCSVAPGTSPRRR